MQTTFCGLPFVPLDSVPGDAVAAVVGAGYSLGTAHPGTENGPLFLRTLSKAHTWSATEPAVVDLRTGRTVLDHVVDVGDIAFGQWGLGDALRLVADTVRALPAGVAPCLVGGDHTITYAAVDALCDRRADPFWVVQFDHHLDLQIWEGAAAAAVPAREPVFNTNVMSHVADRLGPGKLIQIGVSPFATTEASSVDATVGYLRSVGTQICLHSPEIEDPASFARLVGRGRDVYVSIDVDVLDSAAMSSTGYPAEVGLGVRELLRLVDLVLRHNRLIGFDLVEFSARKDARDPKTLADAARAVTIVLHLLTALHEQRRAQGAGA